MLLTDSLPFVTRRVLKPKKSKPRSRPYQTVPDEHVPPNNNDKVPGINEEPPPVSLTLNKSSAARFRGTVDQSTDSHTSNRRKPHDTKGEVHSSPVAGKVPMQSMVNPRHCMESTVSREVPVM